MITFLVSLLVCVGLTLVLNDKLTDWKDRKQYPYRWSCDNPDCNFEVATNSILVTDRLASAHERKRNHRE